jgi:hypothetical protein
VNTHEPQQLNLLQDQDELTEGFDGWDIFNAAQGSQQPTVVSGCAAERRGAETCRTQEGDGE